MAESFAKRPLDLQPLESAISLPYRLTPGRATGTFLTELGARRIVGTHCRQCNRVEVPAQDVCQCGNDELEFVQMGEQGVLTSYTEMAGMTLGLIRFDGAACDFLHRCMGEGPWTIGQRVQAVWADSPKGSVLDLQGFRAAGAQVTQAPAPLSNPLEPMDSFPATRSLSYRHAHGPYYGRLFDEMHTSGRILGVRCPSCHSTLVPPRELCDVCYVRTGTWVDVADTGVLQAFSIIHLKFVGQTREPPYVYAEIMLDGSSTKMIHVLDGVDIDQAPKLLRPGMRVKAVWRKERQGSLSDITHFELTGPQD